MPYMSIILAIVAVAIAVYHFFFKNLDHYKKHGILHTPPVPFFGNMAPFIFGKGGLFGMLKRAYNLHPDAKYVGFYEFMTPTLMIRDVDLAKQITVKNFDHFQDHRAFFDKKLDPLLGDMLFLQEGERWKDSRSILSPVFTSSKIKGMFKLMADCALNLSTHLANLKGKEQELDLKDAVTKYTNDVIASCAFGYSVNSLKDPKNALYVNGRRATTFTNVRQSVILLAQRNLPTLARLLKLSLIEKHIEKFFEDTIMSTVKERDEKGISRSDMLQLLMESRNKSKSLNLNEITVHAFTFYFGGLESVATQTCFALYELAINSEVHNKLQDEIDKTLEETEGKLTYEAVQKMEYLDAVINETMRLYPVAPFLDRLCVKSYELPPALPGAKPYTLEPGMNVWYPVSVIQRDPNYFEEPERFMPERFVNDGKRILNSGTFVPFGIGPRMCIGNRFALIEMKIVICYILAFCELKCSSKTEIPLTLESRIFGTAAKGGHYYVKVEPRQNPSPYLQALSAS